jgi:hypothetical protein
MEQTYPLYYSLLEKVKNRKAEEGIHLQQLCNTINNIALTMSPDEYMEHYIEIGLLMTHHEFITTGVLFSEAPYNSKVFPGGNGIMSICSNLPILLQEIIAEYIESQKE